MADWAKSVQQEVEQEVEQSLVCHQLLCLPYQLCSNQLLKLKKQRISAIKGKNTIMGGGGVFPLMAFMGKLRPKGPGVYLFQASGIWKDWDFTC